LPSTVAVGLASPRSILLIMAFDTPERTDRSASDQPRALRSRFSEAEMASVGSSVMERSLDQKWFFQSS